MGLQITLQADLELGKSLRVDSNCEMRSRPLAVSLEGGRARTGSSLELRAVSGEECSHEPSATVISSSEAVGASPLKREWNRAPQNPLERKRSSLQGVGQTSKQRCAMGRAQRAELEQARAADILATRCEEALS